jgi:beta-N-acetylhexosaminidase
MLAFEGTALPPDVAARISSYDIAGVTLFRPDNYESPAQLRALTDALQLAAKGDLPILIAIDQEGGQLHAFGDPATMWPGNMALGAADDPQLTHRVAAAMGTELRAVGVNVDYAPVADLATNPGNPATGARSFGEPPTLVATHVAAFVEGLQSAGVAATMKHFPGKGDSAVDSHHGLPVLDHTREELMERELVPFIAAIEAGVWLAMTGHVAIPSITGSASVPGTLSIEMNTGLLRTQLGFDGVLISDALDMKALSQDIDQVEEIIEAVRSGVDLLLMTADPELQQRVTRGLSLAASRKLIPQRRFDEANERMIELRRWISEFGTPSIATVGSDEHEALCLQAAARSATLVKDDASLIPLGPDASILVVETEPTTLTPADTSDYETPYLAEEIAKLTNGTVTGIVTPYAPTSTDIASAVARADSYDVIVVGTVAAHLEPAQGELVEALMGGKSPVIAVSQRTPWDIEVYPSMGTYLCAWSANRLPSRATANALFGHTPISGRLPVSVNQFPVGHGLDRA